MRDLMRNVTRDMMRPAMHVARRSQPWLGTLVEISARHVGVTCAHRAIDAGFAAISHIHRAMSPQIAGSDVDRINRAAVGEAVDVCESTWQVLCLAEDLNRRSDGLFDCAVGTHRPRSSQRDLDLSRERIIIKRGPLAIDLGGIAKGYAVDAAIDALGEAGAASACVNAGGDIAVFGDQTFRVDVRDPFEPRLRHRLVELRDFALATSSIEESNALLSGPHARDVDRKAFDRGDSVCVLAPRCVLADALTKVVALSGATSHALVASCGASAIVLPSRHG